MISSVSAYT